MLELYKTGWCPTSRRVREDLTELGLDYLIRQVPSSAKARTVLLPAIGTDTIPALLLEDGSAVVGEEAIEGYLDEQFDETLEAEAHRSKAAKAQRRYLEEECKCLQPATHCAPRPPCPSPTPSSGCASN